MKRSEKKRWRTKSKGVNFLVDVISEADEEEEEVFDYVAVVANDDDAAGDDVVANDVGGN